ncbi:MAG: hypothetical protein KA711_02210 [Ideonella sp. WA131b]|jgi:hypothetical protein|nr:hypothetical protein [Ideonella sp. WA131b]
MTTLRKCWSAAADTQPTITAIAAVDKVCDQGPVQTADPVEVALADN